MGILFCGGHNLYKEHLLGQPVTEMQEHVVSNIIIGKNINDIGISAIEVFHGLSDIGRVKRLIIKNCIHAISSILNIYIEGFSSVRLRKNHLFDHAIVLTK